MTRDELTRFTAKFEERDCGFDTPCWIWTSVTTKGYGRFRAGRFHRAHKLAYEHWVGPVPDGLVLDHKCRQRACVNPPHLEPVTNAVNLVRAAQARRVAAEASTSESIAFSEALPLWGEAHATETRGIRDEAAFDEMRATRLQRARRRSRERTKDGAE
jgi:hypothetical protein